MTFRILVAEDEPLSRRDLVEILGELGHQVVAEARDGAEALTKIADTDPDVVLLDLVMPGTDGLDVAQRIARERPVIILTAHDDRGRRERARSLGVMAWLGKPFREQDIQPTIEFAVANFIERRTLSARVRRLSEQLEARKVIDRAKGLLMERDALSEPQAHRALQKEAMERNLSVERVAEALVAALG